MNDKRFELRIILSFLHADIVQDTTYEEVRELAEHMAGRNVDEPDVAELRHMLTQHISEHVRNGSSLLGLGSVSNIDTARYNKMIDLYGKMHSIPAAVLIEA